MNRRNLPEQREKLDRQIRRWKPGRHQPQHGWIREVREALGMSAKQLAKLLNRSQPAISLLERAEIKGTIRLGTLRKAAEAMDCRLYYLIAPPRGQKLSDVTKERALRISTFPTMLKLRKAGLLDEMKDGLVHEFIAQDAENVKPRDLWDDEDPEPIVHLVMRNIFPTPAPAPPKDPAKEAEEARIDALAHLAVVQARQAREEREKKAAEERKNMPPPAPPPPKAPAPTAATSPIEAERAAAAAEAWQLIEEIRGKRKGE